jgi:4-amino-4-deoxy-L-arabinose transferase-like glycosyltransferase
MKIEKLERSALESPRAGKILLTVMAAGLLMRLVLLYATRDTGLMIVDEQHYHALALNLLHGNGFAWGPRNLTSIRPPLYPAFLALVWKMTGTESLFVIRIAQILVALANIYLVYRLGLFLFDSRIALLAALSLCVYPSILAFNVFILTEVLFTFLLTLMVLGVVTLLKTNSAWVASCSGVVLGLAALTRSVLWPFPAIACPFLLFALPGSWWRRFVIVALFCMGYAAVVMPWAIRNTRLQGVPTMIDTMGGIALRMGNYEYTPLNRAWDPVTLHGDKSIFQGLREEHPDVPSWTEGQKEKWMLRKAPSEANHLGGW